MAIDTPVRYVPHIKRIVGPLSLAIGFYMTTEKDITLNLDLTTDIVCTYVRRNPVTAEQIPDLIRSVSESLGRLTAPQPESASERGKPVVSIRRSLQDDYLVCFEDGKKFKSLKRHNQGESRPYTGGIL